MKWLLAGKDAGRGSIHKTKWWWGGGGGGGREGRERASEHDQTTSTVWGTTVRASEESFKGSSCE